MCACALHIIGLQGVLVVVTVTRNWIKRHLKRPHVRRILLNEVEHVPFFFNATGPISRRHFDSSDNFFLLTLPLSPAHTSKQTESHRIFRSVADIRASASERSRTERCHAVLCCSVVPAVCVYVKSAVISVIKTSVTRREQRVHAVWKKRKMTGKICCIVVLLHRRWCGIQAMLQNVLGKGSLSLLVILSQR
jgi:hypothetical protein